jgi:DNA-binding CsgD family transcriptional regulator
MTSFNTHAHTHTHAHAPRETGQALRSVARSTEAVCGLPAVATQDWCDRAAAALLPIVGSGVALTLLGQIDDRGHIVRQEATGVAGIASVDVSTTMGRAISTTQTLVIDPNDPSLVRVRTNLAQARDLSYSVGPLAPGSIKVGTPDRFASSAHDPMSLLMRRWDAYRLAGMLIGVACIGPGGRCLVVELGSTSSPAGEPEVAALETVLPVLARRAIMAIGSDPSEAAHWLTAREQVILQHLLLGKSVREIAEELGRSPHTVHDHVKSLHRKLNASSRGELVAKALGYADLNPSKTHEHNGTATSGHAHAGVQVRSAVQARPASI